jgi:hypothetical protein
VHIAYLNLAFQSKDRVNLLEAKVQETTVAQGYLSFSVVEF